MIDRSKLHWLSIAVVLFGCALITKSLWIHILDPLIFDATGDVRSDGFFPTLPRLLLRLQWSLLNSEFYGVWVTLFGLGGLPFTMPENHFYERTCRDQPYGAAALAVTLGAHLMVLLFSLPFVLIRSGQSIRPMGWVALMFDIEAAAFVMGMSLAIVSLLTEKSNRSCKISIPLSCTPLFFSIFLLHFIAAMKGFQVSG